jgi:hypothetical protein
MKMMRSRAARLDGARVPDDRGAVVAATLRVKLLPLIDCCQIKQARWHLWDVDALPEALTVGTRREPVRLGSALCGREGEVAFVYGPEATELLILESSGYRNHGGCSRCLSVYHRRAGDPLAAGNQLL